MHRITRIPAPALTAVKLRLPGLLPPLRRGAGGDLPRLLWHPKSAAKVKSPFAKGDFLTAASLAKGGCQSLT